MRQPRKFRRRQSLSVPIACNIAKPQTSYEDRMVGPRTQVKSIVTGRPTFLVPEAMSMDWPHLSLTMAQDAKNSPVLQSTLHRTVIAWPSRPKP